VRAPIVFVPSLFGDVSDVAVAKAGSALELSKCAGQKSRLRHQPLGAAVGGRAGLEQIERAALEVVHAVPAQPQLVVEAQDLGNEPGPDLERRRQPGLTRRATRRAKQRLALGARQHLVPRVETFGKTLRQLARRDEVRQDDGGRGTTQPRFDAVNEMRCRGAGGDDDETIARVER
jgi:hypothetical protein